MTNLCISLIVILTFTSSTLSAPPALTLPSAGVKASDDFEIIILHNNDMHARFAQTDKYSSECSGADAAKNHCYGGFARVAHM
jgi:2',3'-cyclic-nucleotide 2'-phosphodiesterase (5'-nucleotidase family)